MKFSIIIPVYNVAPYLRECLDSVLSQSFTDFEVICVNDGSSDGSINILNEFSNRDSRFHTVNQNNQGVSVARNRALSMVKGEYILFVDGDDVIHPSALERLWGVLCLKNVDAVVFKLIHFLDGGEVDWPTNDGGQVQYFDLKNSMEGSPTYNFTCCAYSRRVLKGLTFGPQIVGEDILFLKRVMLRAGSMAKINDVLYAYRTRNGSAIRSAMSMHNLLGRIDIANNLLAEYQNSKKIIPTTLWRMDCNALMESIPMDWRLLSKEEQLIVRRCWRDCVRYVLRFNQIPKSSRLRMRVVLLFPLLTHLLCCIPAWIKARGFHR